MDSKGQNLTVEQMLLFFISITAMVVLYYSFSRLTGNVGQEVGRDQLRGVTEVTLTGIYRAYNSYEEQKPESKKIRAEIPKEISGEMYRIVVEEDEIRAETDGELEVTRSIGEITEDVSVSMDEGFRQGVSSRKGSILVELDGSEIIIGR